MDIKDKNKKNADEFLDELGLNDININEEIESIDKKMVEVKAFTKKRIEKNASTPKKSTDRVFKWYLISTVNGKEEKVREALQNKIAAAEMKDLIHEIKMFTIPHLSKKEFEKYKAGDKDFIVKYKNLYPSYMFLNMHMTDKSWFLVRNTEFVTGLIGSSGKGAKPTPISIRRWKTMLKHEEKAKKDFYKDIDNFSFSPGQLIKVVAEGAYLDQIGVISKVDGNNGVVFIPIEQFGRLVETQFSFKDVTLVSDVQEK